ncbi:MAG: glycosyltransferase [Anaerolineales bacterium]|nr:glycosyltransferase [Anaerolineales bacterium]
MANPLKLSVVVVCLNAADVREACLHNLAQQAHPEEVEVLAVGCWSAENMRSDANSDSIVSSARFPGIRWLSVSPDTTVPQMRTYGILQSRGEIIALLEDDCAISDGWLTNVMQAHAQAHPIIGGAIVPGNYRRWLDWAIYFCEYGRFMPPFSGAQRALPGNNVTYKKTSLPILKPGDGFYEVFFHESWQNAGGELLSDAKLSIENINHWSLRHTTQVPYHHGRAFAGMRSADFPVWRRGVYALLSLALPLLKAYRLAAVAFNRRRYGVQFIFSLPWVMVFLASWSLGELVGYAAGAGQSLEQWR